MKFMYYMALVEALIASLFKSEVFALVAVTMAILTVADTIKERGDG